MVDKRKAEGRPEKTTSGDVVKGSSSQITAAIVGTSQATVERARVIIDAEKTDADIKKEVAVGDKSFRAGAREVLDRKRRRSAPVGTATAEGV